MVHGNRSFTSESELVVVYQVRKFFSDLFIRLAINVVFFSHLHRFTFGATAGLNEVLRSSSTLSFSSLNEQKELMNLSAQAKKYDHIGQYEQAKRARIQIHDIQHQLSSMPRDYFPPLIGSKWTSFIGHLAVLAIHSKAQEFSLLPQGKRYIMNTKSIANNSIFDLFRHNYIELADGFLSQLENSPLTQVLFENYNSVKTTNGYVETHAFIEQVFSLNQLQNNGIPLYTKKQVVEVLEPSAELWIHTHIKEPFVAVHLRNTGKSERRDVEVQNYFESFQFLLSEGFQIVNIGPEVQHIGDLAILNAPHRGTHPYIMSHAAFAITSTSGPSVLPGLFQTPNLHTNLTSIGRNMINYHASTYYLPKAVVRHGRILSMREILASEFAYDEQSLCELAQSGMSLQENTSNELLAAIRCMVSLLETNSNSASGNFAATVRRIQAEFNAATHGQFIPSILESMPSFLD